MTPGKLRQSDDSMRSTEFRSRSTGEPCLQELGEKILGRSLLLTTCYLAEDYASKLNSAAADHTRVRLRL